MGRKTKKQADRLRAYYLEWFHHFFSKNKKEKAIPKTLTQVP